MVSRPSLSSVRQSIGLLLIPTHPMTVRPEDHPYAPRWRPTARQASDPALEESRPGALVTAIRYRESTASWIVMADGPRGALLEDRRYLRAPKCSSGPDSDSAFHACHPRHPSATFPVHRRQRSSSEVRKCRISPCHVPHPGRPRLPAGPGSRAFSPHRDPRQRRHPNRRKRPSPGRLPAGVANRTGAGRLNRRPGGRGPLHAPASDRCRSRHPKEGNSPPFGNTSLAQKPPAEILLVRRGSLRLLGYEGSWGRLKRITRTDGSSSVPVNTPATRVESPATSSRRSGTRTVPIYW